VLIGSGRSVSHWNIPRFQRHADFALRLNATVAASGSRSDNATAQRALGEWYAFRGVDDWAVQLLEKAARNGADVSSLTLARCYWKLGRLADAAREFRSAIADQEAPKDYLNHCLAAVTGADN
jgi:tetratricopeptide (TPR) repeat protein